MLAIMPGWYAMGAAGCDMELAGHHQDDECCESGEADPEESKYDLPTVSELNAQNSESTDHDSGESCDHAGNQSDQKDHKNSDGDCNCCDSCEISSGTPQPSDILDEALTLETPSSETHLYEKEILLSPDHHQVAELHNEPRQTSAPLYVMNQVFLN